MRQSGPRMANMASLGRPRLSARSVRVAGRGFCCAGRMHDGDSLEDWYEDYEDAKMYGPAAVLYIN